LIIKINRKERRYIWGRIGIFLVKRKKEKEKTMT